MSNLKRKDTCTSLNLRDGCESNCSVIKQIPLQTLQIDKKKEVN